MDSEEAQEDGSVSNTRATQASSWKKLFSQGKSSTGQPITVTAKRPISARREASVCLLCVQEGKTTFHMIDNYDSTIKRHAGRHHAPPSIFNPKRHIRPEGHEEVKAVASSIKRIQNTTKTKILSRHSRDGDNNLASKKLKSSQTDPMSDDADVTGIVANDQQQQQKISSPPQK